MRGWKVPVIGALAALFVLAEGCGQEEQLSTSTQELTGTQSTSFQDGVLPTTSYAGTRDSMIEEESPNTNNGGDTSISASGDTPAGSGNENYLLLQ